MDCQLSCASPLPQIWVVEALAHSDHVDISLLLDLLEKTPQVSDDLGRNARELVSLRILESLLVQGDLTNPVSSTSNQKIRLDPSDDSCEDVLGRILTEISPSHIQPPGPDMSKWDLQPFIEHKRSSLAGYALRQLKNAMLTGSHSILASLKERSGLPDGKETEHVSSVDEGNCNGITPRTEGTNTNDGDLLRKNVIDENLPVNRKRGATNENARDTLSENPYLSKSGCETHIQSVKKYKHDIICSEQNVEERRDYEDRNAEVYKNGSHHGEGVINEDMDKMQHGNVGEGEEDVDVSTDSDGYHDERTNIDTKKKTFLSSQCTYSQDSLARTDWRELNVCVKCNLSGKLLVCSSESCSLVIHQRCLGLDAILDTPGEFYCPFCAYSRAISKFMEIKKKAALARKDLATLMCPGTETVSNKPPQRLCKMNQNNLEQDDGLVKHANMRYNKGSLHPPETDLPCDNISPQSSQSADEEKTSKVTGGSKYFTRVRKQEKKLSYPAILQARRKRLPWTSKEEEKLKEGIRIHCRPQDSIFPWKTVLDHGAGVFHQSRSAIDLKDKWRNMCKAASKSK